MNFLITGGTGLVGKALLNSLMKQGHSIYCLTRSNHSTSNPNLTYIKWLSNNSITIDPLPHIDIVINLAGYSLNSGRWTAHRKELIRNSRLEATSELMKIIEALPKKPKLFLNASAIGIYGTSETSIFTEDSPPGDDFLATTVKLWEQEADKATSFGIRTVYCRFGLILSNRGGALPKLILPYKLFTGGKLGSGEQWVSWIHIKDVIHAINFIIVNEHINGAVNFTTPNTLKMKEVGKAIAKHFHRPHWLPVPSFLLKMVLGDMSILIAEGQNVSSEKLQKHHFTFEFNTIKKALDDLY